MTPSITIKSTAIGFIFLAIRSDKSESEISLNFGFTASQEGDIATASVLSTYTKSKSIIVINSLTSSNHLTVEDSLIEDVKFEISDKIEGVGFTIYAYAPQGTWGQYNVEYKIIN
jgi:hypothetical protein